MTTLDPRTAPRLPAGMILLAALVLAPMGATALERQDAPAPQAQEPAVADTAPRPIGVQDVMDWKRIMGATLSRDGSWFAYRVSPTEGNSELVVRSTATETEHRFPVGEGGGAVTFSADSRWLAFTITPTREESERGRAQRRSARSKVGLLELSSGEMTEIPDIRSFAFAGERGGWIALSRFTPAPAGGAAGAGASGGSEGDRPRGTDLLLHELATGTRLNLGNVAEYRFDETGRWLAWVVDAEGKAGNGIQLRDMETGVIRVLEGGEARYSNLAWAPRKDALVVLKAVEDKGYEAPLHSVVGWRGFNARGGPVRTAFDPHQDERFPEGMTISPNRPPEWTDALDGLLFGIHEVKAKAGAGGNDDAPSRPDTLTSDERADLVLWHWEDPRLQPMQQVQERWDRDFSYLAVYWPESGRFVRLADDQIRSVSPAAAGHWAVGFDQSPYDLDANLDGRRLRDVYAVDMNSGDRTLILQGARWAYDLSPTGGHFLYYEDGHYHTYEMATGRRHTISRDVPTSFVNKENDLNVVDPPIAPRGWSRDGRYAILHDNWDLWRVSVQGDQGLNLTVNGRDEGIRYRALIQQDPEGRPGFDLSAPLFILPYGEWTKKSGIGRLARGRPGVEMLSWEDAQFGRPEKARDADVFVFTRATSRDYPDYHVTDASFRSPRRITDAFPEQADYLWSSGSILLDYESEKGDRLQGALFLPADYQEGERYPTVVYIYERLSQGLNSYTFPTANGFNKSVYTSHGYAVLMPDITYKVNDPGMSAVWSVLPALEAAIATGVVDRERVGIQGHSWGGYQTSFLITQTDAFAAAVAGAPLTNMISMYSAMYWNTGSANQPIFESSQGRFTGGYWEVLDAYTRNSPVYFAQEVSTPLLLLHNDKDGAVDFTQGIEYYNTLRRLRKPVVMLQYKGENHGLAKRANQKDYTVRMLEFFDHYLKGAQAPEWWTDGVPHLEMEEHLKERIHLVRPGERKGEGTKTEGSEGRGPDTGRS
jgi:dipeptidyl aminopeptidase/acylaminoacyl peptidase